MTATNGRTPAPSVDDLLPRAVALTQELGEVPSVRRLTSELRIGAPKARVLVERVAETQRTQADPASDSASEPITDAAPTPAPDKTPTPGPDAPTAPAAAPRPVHPWPLLILALPASVAIWSGWVGLGGLTGFGVVHPLPGIVDSFSINSAITLPIGVEAYAAYALRAWLTAGAPEGARRFAKWSAIGSLVLGAAGQVAYHLMASAGMTAAPWQITTAVSCLPVAVLGMGAALAHLLRGD